MSNKVVELPTGRTRGRPKAGADKIEQNTIKSLDRALLVLMELGRYDGISLTDLSNIMGESAATLYRVLVTMQGRGFTEFDDARQLWFVGSGAFLSGMPFVRRAAPLERARPILRQLMRATGETAAIAVIDGNSACFADQVDSPAPMRAVFALGSPAPLHASAAGKAILSAFDADTRHEIVHREEHDRLTDFTILRPRRLKQEIALCHEHGFSVDDQEHVTGLRAVAAPVFDAMGNVVAALTVSGPVERIEALGTNAVGHSVRDAAATLSEALGFKIQEPISIAGE